MFGGMCPIDQQPAIGRQVRGLSEHDPIIPGNDLTHAGNIHLGSGLWLPLQIKNLDVLRSAGECFGINMSGMNNKCRITIEI